MSARELKLHHLPNDRASVALIGDHDAYSADQIERTVRALLAEGLDVEIDLRDATFVDSTIVGALIEAHRSARESGSRFTVVIGKRTGWAVRRLFELTQLDAFLTVSKEG